MLAVSCLFYFACLRFTHLTLSFDFLCPSNSSDPTELSTKVEFAAAFDYAQLVIDNRFVDPMAKFFELFSSQGRQMKKAIKTMDDYCYKIIDARVEAKASGSAKGAVDSKGGKDLLDLFMDKGTSRSDLRICVLNFLIAGRDTTAQTLSWLFYEFYQNPE